MPSDEANLEAEEEFIVQFEDMKERLKSLEGSIEVLELFNDSHTHQIILNRIDEIRERDMDFQSLIAKEIKDNKSRIETIAGNQQVHDYIWENKKGIDEIVKGLEQHADKHGEYNDFLEEKYETMKLVLLRIEEFQRYLVYNYLNKGKDEYGEDINALLGMIDYVFEQKDKLSSSSSETINNIKEKLLKGDISEEGEMFKIPYNRLNKILEKETADVNWNSDVVSPLHNKEREGSIPTPSIKEHSECNLCEYFSINPLSCKDKTNCGLIEKEQSEAPNCIICGNQMEMDLNTLNSGIWYCHNCEHKKSTPAEQPTKYPRSPYDDMIGSKPAEADVNRHNLCTKCGGYKYICIECEENIYHNDKYTLKSEIIAEFLLKLQTIRAYILPKRRAYEIIQEIEDEYKQKLEGLEK